MTPRFFGSVVAKAAGAAVNLVGPLFLVACASSAITRSGALSSYDHMTAVKTTRAKALIRTDEAVLSAAKTVRIEPVTFTPGAGAQISSKQGALIANAIGRVLCAKLSKRYDIVAADTPADLTLKVAVTRIAPTDTGVVAGTFALRIAGTVVGVPFPVRLPLGMGAFSAEAEAIDAMGVQHAAMVWARGADMFTTPARLSKIGDAYEISGAFAGDLAKLVITGRNPLREFPSMGAAGKKRPVSPVCAAYGKSHGGEYFVSGFVGAPPEWTDNAASSAGGQLPPAPSH